MTGNSVKQLQDYLVSAGYMTREQVNTGYGTYGPQTTAAVAALQKKLGVDNSTGVGYWGPRTIAALQQTGGAMPSASQLLEAYNKYGSLTAQQMTGNAPLFSSDDSNEAMSSANFGSSSSAINLGNTSSYWNNNNSSALIEGIIEAQKALMKSLENTPERQESNSIKDWLKSNLSSLTGRGAAQAQAEEQYGVNTKRTALTELNNQINQKLAEYRKIEADFQALSTDVEGKPMTMNSIIGSQAQINRQLAVQKNSFAADIGLLQAQASALQGQLTDAQNMANRAVDLKYQDIQSEIDLRLQMLELIQPELTRQEKERAEAQSRIFDLYKTVIGTQVANEKDINATLLNLLQSYPDAGIVIGRDDINSAQQKIQQNSQIYKKGIQKNPTGQQLDSSAINSANSQLMNARGSDGYTDPNLYARLRASSGISPNEFDNRFGYLVNPLSRAKLGLTTTNVSSATSKGNLTPEQQGAINDAKAAIDMAKQRFMDWGSLRSQIIEQEKAKSGFDLSPWI
jgi:hypothetical protein